MQHTVKRLAGEKTWHLDSMNIHPFITPSLLRSRVNQFQRFSRITSITPRSVNILPGVMWHLIMHIFLA